MIRPDRRQSATAQSARHGWSPEFRSKPERLRLLVLVVGLMVVLVAMNEARNPATWAFLWRGARPAAADRQPINTRIPLPPQQSDELPGTVLANSFEINDQNQKETNPARSADTGAIQGSTLADQQRQAWRHVWDTLAYEEKNHLTQLLRTARRGRNASEHEARQWQPLVNKLDRSWDEFFHSNNSAALLPEIELPPEQRRSILQSLTDLEKDWNDRLKPAFEIGSLPRDWSAEQRAALGEVQKILDVIALNDVRDDTVWRAAERAAWFRLLETLQQSDPQELSRQSLGHVGFVQIFRQASEYRGKIVTVRGTARLTYRVAAPTNDLGIEEYCLFWIQPEDGSNRPIVVYALEPPDGFPQVTRDPLKIHEQVEVTGYFFKRWVYRAADGLNSVPLLVTAAPTWHPPAEPQRTGHERLEAALGPLFWPVMSVVLATLALAVGGLIWLVKRSTSSSAVVVELRAQAETAAQQTSSWTNLPATPSIAESLRHLEEQPPGN